jgi:hypothetical protein
MLDLLEVASEPTRRRLVQLLGSGERAVTELADLRALKGILENA